MTTPIELPSGRVIRAPDALGEVVASEVGGVFRPDDVVELVRPVGERWVRKIHAGDRVYAAGTTPTARVFTHNMLAKP